MKYSLRILILPTLIWCVAPGPATGSVIFKPGEKTKYVAPGEEEISGTAQELFARAQAAEKDSDLTGAIKTYRVLVRRYPRDTLAPHALYRLAQLQEQKGAYLKAAQNYDILAEKFPKSEYFDESISALFRIGEMYLAGRKVKLLGIPFKASMDEAANIFTAITRAAPYGKYTPRALFNLGRAREKQGANEAALTAYQSVIEKFPNDPLAVDAQYQIGYIWSTASRSGNTYDPNAAAKAKTGFEDFLYRYPNSEKSAQARENLKKVEHQQTSTAFEIARYYDKQKQYRAAAIYYNDVIRQQPDSREGDEAKKRISELRAKIGDAALQPASDGAATVNKKNKKPETIAPPSGRSESESRSDAALPDIDLSLPPPASLLPDNTTAPPSTTDTLPNPTEAATPEAPATPEE